MPVHVVEPWTDARWDAYVASHARSTIYHTSAWIRIVCDIGRYPCICLLHESDGRVDGLLPLVAVESRLTGRRVSSLPFSDVGYPIADDARVVQALIERAVAIRDERRAAFYEMRGTPALQDGSETPPAPLGARSHFFNYVIPLAGDPDAVRQTFSRKAVRQTITKGARLGVSVRRGGASDLDAFYSLYVRNRRRHGIPPQPRALFSMVLERLTGDPGASLYLAEHEATPVAALIMVRYGGVTYAKYEGVDETRRELVALYPLFWKTIEDAILAGDREYDFGRTDADNVGLNEFKKRWGTTVVELPYYFDPPAEGMSVVRSDSLKYRLFTGAFRRMPASWAVGIGARIFRHFG